MAILLADIGGTNARFKWQKGERLGSLLSYKCDDFKTPYQVIEKAIADSAEKFDGFVLAGAGPVQKGTLQWTNRLEWKISERELKKRYSIKKVLIINDVLAQGEGLKSIYSCNNNTILMTAGTGLGACFILNNQVIPGEVGQVKTKENLKIEDFISGPGIVRIYHQLGGSKTVNSARRIEVLRTTDKKAEKAYQTFYQKWGELSAQLVTAFYATGGIYLWGGLIPKNKKDKAVLLKSYQKNLPESFLKVPLHLVKDESLSFKGLSVVSRREFGQS